MGQQWMGQQEQLASLLTWWPSWRRWWWQMGWRQRARWRTIWRLPQLRRPPLRFQLPQPQQVWSTPSTCSKSPAAHAGLLPQKVPMGRSKEKGEGGGQGAP